MKLYNMDEKMMIKYKNISSIRALLESHHPQPEFHNNTCLIPRNVTNHILVFVFGLDMRMDSQRSRRPGPPRINDNDPHGDKNLKLHVAVRDGDLNMVKTVLKHCRKVIKSTDDKGWTPLSYAAFLGHLDIVQHLLDKFPNSISYPNSDDERSLPVHKACLGGQIEILKHFHSISSEKLFDADRNGRNVFHIAAKEGDNKLKDVVSYLVGLADNNETCRKALNKEDGHKYKPLDLALRSKNHAIAKQLREAMKALNF